MKILNNLEHLERHSPPQLTLGGLIKVLQALPADTMVESIFDHTSYRGYYDHIALVINRPCKKRYKPEAIISHLEQAYLILFDGYKGGNYRMTKDTPVWIADWGDNSGLAVVGVEAEGGQADFIAHNTKDEESDDVAHNYL